MRSPRRWASLPAGHAAVAIAGGRRESLVQALGHREDRPGQGNLDGAAQGDRRAGFPDAGPASQTLKLRDIAAEIAATGELGYR